MEIVTKAAYYQTLFHLLALSKESRVLVFTSKDFFHFGFPFKMTALDPMIEIQL